MSKLRFYQEFFSEEFSRVNDMLQGIRDPKYIAYSQDRLDSLVEALAAQIYEASTMTYGKSFHSKEGVVISSSDGTASKLMLLNGVVDTLEKFSKDNPELAKDHDNGFGGLVSILPKLITVIQTITDLKDLSIANHQFALFCQESSLGLIYEVIQTQVFDVYDDSSTDFLGDVASDYTSS